MGHGHEPPYKVPDYKIYKVEDVPQLEKIQRALHSQGLHDPWLRNEVWRYDAKSFGTMSSRLKACFPGFFYGLGAAVVTVAATKAYYAMFPSEHDDHGHH